ncbi:MAG: asparagine synthase (glutamine-hydrolyzing) [Alphaproteobacteria bacterium]|nr:asparagine synthase (glutamine-hydrolyzing) [Alphaproteobacteria bacterium]
MSGIAGTLTFDSGRFRVTERYLTAMADTLTHRGPDGAGAWIAETGRIGLAQRSLAHGEPPKPAHQPAKNPNGTLRAVLDGQIFNYWDVRRELDLLSEWQWQSDHWNTELVLHAFEQWGIDCVQKFRGIFTFALWDAGQQELWLVRDRIGIKSMFYSLHSGRLSFASEIKALLRDPDQVRTVNEEAVYHYLTFHATPAPLTMFEGIKRLQGGCWLRVNSRGDVREERYWDVLDHLTPLDRVNDDEIAAQVLQELTTSIQLQVVPEAPVGVFLSGGLDSSTNAILLAANRSEPIRTFTVGYEGDYDPENKLGAKGASYRNETLFAHRVANEISAVHAEKLLGIDDLIDIFPQLIRCQDEPIADPGCIPLYYLGQLARDNGVSFCHSGEGADALFFGGSGQRTLLKLQHLNDRAVPGALKRLGLVGIGHLADRERFPYERLRRAVEGEAIYWAGGELFTDAEKMRILSARLRRRFADFTSWQAVKPIRKRFEEKAPARAHLLWMNYVDLNLRSPEWLLTRLDRMTMGNGCEVCVPYLDHKLVELALSIPEPVRTRNGTSKYILKKAVRGTVSDEIIDREKQGLGAPIHEWFLDRLGPLARVEIEAFCRETDIFETNEVMGLLDEQPNRPVPRTRQTWGLLNMALWWKEYIK